MFVILNILSLIVFNKIHFGIEYIQHTIYIYRLQRKVTAENVTNSKFFWKSACYLYDKKKLVTLWKRKDLHIPTRFTQIQRTLLQDAKVLKNSQMPKLSLDYLHLFTFFVCLPTKHK